MASICGKIQTTFLNHSQRCMSRCNQVHGLNVRARSTTVPPWKKGSVKTKGKGYALLIIPGAGFCLGTWQVKRRKWKLDLIEKLEQRTRAAPVDLPFEIGELPGLEYSPVKIRGSFEHARETFIYPRFPVQDEDGGRQGGGGMVKDRARSGANVITAFHLADRDETILVNRGWVSRNQMNPANRQEGQVEGEVELVGFVRQSERKPAFTADNEPEKNEFHFRDVEAMAQQLNTSPILLDVDEKSSVKGGPLGGQTRVTLRNEHLSYLLTWYTLAVITSGMWYMRYMK